MNNMITNNSIPTMLGVKEIAQRFGIAVNYARQLALSGKVKAVRVGRGKILINAESVAEFFDNSYISDSSAPAQVSGITPIPAKL